METVKEMCGDNRFEVIQRAKEHLIEATNIEQSLDEMKVLDIFLFRAWQMGWLRQYEPTLRNATDKKYGDKSSPSDKWVSVDERLPEEADSIFAKYCGTEKWDNAMFRKCSDDVIVCIEYEDGSRRTGVARTLDGKWNSKGVWKTKVTHWMPLPEPPKGVQ